MIFLLCLLSMKSMKEAFLLINYKNQIQIQIGWVSKPISFIFFFIISFKLQSLQSIAHFAYFFVQFLCPQCCKLICGLLILRGSERYCGRNANSLSGYAMNSPHELKWNARCEKLDKNKKKKKQIKIINKKILKGSYSGAH